MTDDNVTDGDLHDDDLERALRAARPHTGADDGWATSADGDRTLAAIRRRTAVRERLTIHPGRRLTWGIGLAAAVAAAVAVGVLASGAANPRNVPLAGPSESPIVVPPGGAPPRLALVSYTNCDAMLDGLRSHLASHIGPYGLGGYGGIRYGYSVSDTAGKVAVPQASSAGGAAEAPAHSTTNVQEIGVGEPDIVETDGRRIISVSGGMLRVVDVASHKVTGTLDLNEYAGASSAQLLMSGDRVLVILGTAVPYYRGGPYIGPAIDYYGYAPSNGGSTYLLVDLAQPQPRIVDTLHTGAGYVDARMVGDTVRLVVQSSPKLTFPTLPERSSNKQRTASNRDVVNHAPLSAWLPTYQTTSAGVTATHTVPCARVSHPVHFTGESMLTVFTMNLGGDLTDPQPITLAADGTSVYASTSSLYVASTNGTKTQLHRFTIAGTGRPTYVGSGGVPGYLLDAYSMSEYDGALRVVTTQSVNAAAATGLYTLNASTLHVLGHVGGLGRGEQLHAVRFLGPLGYVVTFESVDPLYVLDLHDPAHPRRAGALTITGYSDYLHPVSTGRLLGVGESVNSQQIVTGLQVSLFDVDKPGHPKRIAKVLRSHTPSETPIDPHAFLFWPDTGTAVVPINSWNPDQSGAAVVLHVSKDGLQVQGTIRNPAVSSVDSYDTGIERTMIIGSDIWTMSSSGLQSSDLHSLDKRAWVPFQ
jgi:hypothetical protein